MASHDADAAGPDTGSALTSAYVRVLVLEAIVVAALVWLGWHFA